MTSTDETIIAALHRQADDLRFQADEFDLVVAGLTGDPGIILQGYTGNPHFFDVPKALLNEHADALDAFADRLAGVGS